MIYQYVIQRIPKCDYQGLDFPQQLQQSLLQLKENLASNFGLVFTNRNYISEERSYRVYSFQAKDITIKIIASHSTKSYEVVIDYNLPSWHSYLTEALETYFNLYSQAELLKKVKNETKDRKNAIVQLINGTITITGGEIEPEILKLLEEALKDEDLDLLLGVLWSLPETPYLLKLKPILEEMRANHPDEDVKSVLNYLFDYEFPDDLPSEEVVETSLSLNEQSIDEVHQEVLESRHIKSLYLSENNLIFLPEEIGNLTELRILGVHGNFLTALPKSLIKLQNLEEIYAYNNQIQEFPQLPASIKKIYLSRNQIQIIPATVENLTSLEWLDLDNNNIQEIHPHISKLLALEYLDLSNNPLYTIPAGITCLPKLQTLLLHSCPVEEFPNAFPGLKELTTLVITESNISSIKPSIQELISLEELRLNTSHITEIPKDIIFPKNLQSIALDSSNLNKNTAKYFGIKSTYRTFSTF